MLQAAGTQEPKNPIKEYALKDRQFYRIPKNGIRNAFPNDESCSEVLFLFVRQALISMQNGDVFIALTSVPMHINGRNLPFQTFVVVSFISGSNLLSLKPRLEMWKTE